MAEIHKRVRVGIAGSYGGLNLGDEAILQVMASQLRNSVPVDLTVFCHNPDDTRTRHAIERCVPLDHTVTREELRPEIERLDLLILGGGGILFDSYAQLHLRPVEVALEIGTPVMVYAVGAGPLSQPNERQLVCQCLTQVDLVTVRALSTRKLLEEIGVRRNIEVTADPAFLLEPEPLPPDTLAREGLEDRRRLVGISVREPGPAAPDMDEQRHHQLLANAADFIVDRYDADVVFVPMERRVLDLQQAHAVISQMGFADRATVLKGQYTPSQMLSLMGHFTFAVGMRLHFLIFAALQRVPFVALPYASKVASFLEDLGIPMPPLKVVNAGRVIAHIDRCWDLRHDHQARIDQSLPGLRARAQRSHQLALDLLNRRSAANNPSQSVGA